jgi:hypothetical protein
MLTRTTNVEALMQTPEQQITGSVTFRAYIDEAWRNIEGLALWKHAPQKELVQLIEEVYEKSKRK